MSTPVVRRVLLIALFVLFSAILFTLLLPVVFAGIIAYLQNRTYPPEFFVTIWTTITLALSVTLAALAFWLIAFVTEMRRR